MKRVNVLLGNPYEEIVGFSRAVRVGPIVAVGGTAPIGEDGETVGVGDVRAQARRCYEIIGQALEGAGASWSDVVRVRNFLTRADDFHDVIAIRREFVGEFKPVDTVVVVTRFVNPEWLLEVEVDAVVAAPGSAEVGE